MLLAQIISVFEGMKKISDKSNISMTKAMIEYTHRPRAIARLTRQKRLTGLKSCQAIIVFNIYVPKVFIAY